MKIIGKTLAAGSAAVALAAASASPAQARDRDNGIGAGEVIAGAIILGGLAAILADSDDDYDDDYRYNNRGYNNGYGSYGYPAQRRGRGYGRDAVQQCVYAVQNVAQRRGFSANVTDIRDVDRKRRGLKVKGSLEVQSNRYGGYNRRGYNNYDRGSFTCKYNRGRVTDVNIRGIRGL